jgi:hypothetical protein
MASTVNTLAEAVVTVMNPNVLQTEQASGVGVVDEGERRIDDGDGFR